MCCSFAESPSWFQLEGWEWGFWGKRADAALLMALCNKIIPLCGQLQISGRAGVARPKRESREETRLHPNMFSLAEGGADCKCYMTQDWFHTVLGSGFNHDTILSASKSRKGHCNCAPLGLSYFPLLSLGLAWECAISHSALLQSLSLAQGHPWLGLPCLCVAVSLNNPARFGLKGGGGVFWEKSRYSPFYGTM